MGVGVGGRYCTLAGERLRLAVPVIWLPRPIPALQAVIRVVRIVVGCWEGRVVEGRVVVGCLDEGIRITPATRTPAGIVLQRQQQRAINGTVAE